MLENVNLFISKIDQLGASKLTKKIIFSAIIEKTHLVPRLNETDKQLLVILLNSVSIIDNKWNDLATYLRCSKSYESPLYKHIHKTLDYFQDGYNKNNGLFKLSGLAGVQVSALLHQVVFFLKQKSCKDFASDASKKLYEKLISENTESQEKLEFFLIYMSLPSNKGRKLYGKLQRLIDEYEMQQRTFSILEPLEGRELMFKVLFASIDAEFDSAENNKMPKPHSSSFFLCNRNHTDIRIKWAELKAYLKNVDIYDEPFYKVSTRLLNTFSEGKWTNIVFERVHEKYSLLLTMIINNIVREMHELKNKDEDFLSDSVESKKLYNFLLSGVSRQEKWDAISIYINVKRNATQRLHHLLVSIIKPFVYSDSFNGQMFRFGIHRPISNYHEKLVELEIFFKSLRDSNNSESHRESCNIEGEEITQRVDPYNNSKTFSFISNIITKYTITAFSSDESRALLEMLESNSTPYKKIQAIRDYMAKLDEAYNFLNNGRRLSHTIFDAMAFGNSIYLRG